MKLFSLASISTKAAAVGVLGLAAVGGTGTALVLQPANDTRPPGAEVAETKTEKVKDKVAATDDDGTTTTDTEVLDTTEKVTTDDGAPTTKDNFGAVVSADARDGGVDGQEISAEAHARNETRKAQRSTPPVEDETDDDTDDDADDDTDDTADTADADHTPAARAHGKAVGRKG